MNLQLHFGKKHKNFYINLENENNINSAIKFLEKFGYRWVEKFGKEFVVYNFPNHWRSRPETLVKDKTLANIWYYEHDRFLKENRGGIENTFSNGYRTQVIMPEINPILWSRLSNVSLLSHLDWTDEIEIKFNINEYLLKRISTAFAYPVFGAKSHEEMNQNQIKEEYKREKITYEIADLKLFTSDEKVEKLKKLKNVLENLRVRDYSISDYIDWNIAQNDKKENGNFNYQKERENSYIYAEDIIKEYIIVISDVLKRRENKK